MNCGRSVSKAAPMYKASSLQKKPSRGGRSMQKWGGGGGGGGPLPKVVQRREVMINPRRAQKKFFRLRFQLAGLALVTPI